MGNATPFARMVKGMVEKLETSRRRSNAHSVHSGRVAEATRLSGPSPYAPP